MIIYNYNDNDNDYNDSASGCGFYFRNSPATTCEAIVLAMMALVLPMARGQRDRTSGSQWVESLRSLSGFALGAQLMYAWLEGEHHSKAMSAAGT